DLRPEHHRWLPWLGGLGGSAGAAGTGGTRAPCAAGGPPGGLRSTAAPADPISCAMRLCVRRTVRGTAGRRAGFAQRGGAGSLFHSPPKAADTESRSSGKAVFFADTGINSLK